MSQPQPYPGAPLWVKRLGIAALVIAALAVGALLIGGGEHGPARHLTRGERDAPPSGHADPVQPHTPSSG